MEVGEQNDAANTLECLMQKLEEENEDLQKLTRLEV
jgi:hypothetical protein